MTLVPLSPATSNRTQRALACRLTAAGRDAFAPVLNQMDNGDEAKYADKSGTYSKGILQTGVGLVDLAAFESFKTALTSGDPADFDKITIGPGGRTQNGPQGGLAFDLECLDSSQFFVPPAPTVESEEYAAELIEMYWAALLHDINFSDYGTNPDAKKAIDELSALPSSSYKGPRDGGKVTPNLLFRGSYPDAKKGPYLSQFLLLPAQMGALPITQRYRIAQAGVEHMLTEADYQAVQNGLKVQLSRGNNTFFIRNGRGLTSYTYDDVLYQAYFIALLVLSGPGVGANPNPGSPYAPGKAAATTQNGFNTFGGPDFASLVGAVASEALKAVWYQKWFVHLRHRPESGGALVHLVATGKENTIDAHPSSTVLTSMALAASHARFNSFFLPQAFPDGSPTHPAYPTGHGTVAGACITVLKFFFQNDFKIPNPQVPTNDGMGLQDYTGPDAGDLEVHAELNKLAYNISFGHGTHAGIHWRSDTETSIRLGEAVALSVLQDRANTYNEKFTVQLTKLDGSIATISNE
jgi:hypothetical protein